MPPERLHGLQSLRALAALMVLAGHIRAEAAHYLALDLPGAALPWTRGVDIFFVISGFIVTLSAARFAARPGAFLSRRLRRVVPLYALFTTLMVALLLASPGALKSTSLDPAQIASSYLFLPYERGDGRIAPVLSLGWTLNYEVFFYALLALCLALPRPLAACCAALVGLCLLGPVLPVTTASRFYCDPLILEFTFGIGLARLWQIGLVRPSVPLALTALGLGLVLLVTLHQTALPRPLAAGLPAALIVAAGTLLAPCRPLPWQAIGDASYALYLSHRFPLRAATLLLLPWLPATPWAALAFCGGMVALCLWAALRVHRHIERPLARVLSRRPARLAT
ncbi:acyltransferase [Marinovum sp.]|uniref:acyltransferase family protein n=1 Tax=Marinovum sp. TaxID=2024839 RepID=UPI002B2713AF|nr:acyltransferase [Marinovum sp.]